MYKCMLRIMFHCGKYNTYGFRLSDLKYFCKLYRMWGEEPFLKEEGTRSYYTREMKLKSH